MLLTVESRRIEGLKVGPRVDPPVSGTVVRLARLALGWMGVASALPPDVLFAGRIICCYEKCLVGRLNRC